MTAPITALAQAGTSVWLDDLSRQRLRSGNLAEVIRTKGVVGVTTNPAIFKQAMSVGTAYDEQIAQLAQQGVPAESAVFAMATDDVRDACDLFREIHRDTDGKDGWVSLEVDPRLANDRDATVTQARELAETVDRDNIMIKIPATEDCLPAITGVLGAGISVNVTLIFSVARYNQVVQAFIDGIAEARHNGHDISKIRSVASFFISRVDTEIDARLDTATAAAEAAGERKDFSDLKGKAGIANARLAYDAFSRAFGDSPVWQELAQAGAHVQRPLWASTSVKNAAYPDTLYVTELAGPDTVNTMPEDTLDATIDHAEVTGDTLTGTADDARQVFEKLAAAGIDLADVWEVLEAQGVDKFVSSWEELLGTLDQQLTKA
ncbi:transaldolase [Corynebacterium heidelbergense]|uniref:Transaldolase n=1 Tax=Corynebacterium heidelbergense TaxID=2055947 RepID=A0A364VBI5_9CORY|nr:transaldolase [Corynebacterium heidelbergense]RAV34015.1 transaldolase [Corynebacterium heidelbergense]WCZ36570.1 Transaldolase [Corynebacterium heidelbergense]